jgi:hypothetical protein
MDAAPLPTESIDEDWCSINEAARRLSVTPTAIRNRIKRGTQPTRPNGNLGKLVKVPRTVTLTAQEPVRGTVTLTPEEGASTVTLTPEEPVRGTVTGTVVEERLTVTLTVLASHIEALQAALAKAEAAAERGRMAEIEAAAARAEAAAIPALRDTIAALKAALDSEQARIRDLRRARDAGGPLYRVLRWMRKTG